MNKNQGDEDQELRNRSSESPLNALASAKSGFAEAPWEDLRAGALAEYEAASTVAHSWASVIPRAINFYFDHARWRPIETAPKDGTQILVFTHSGDIELSYWFSTETDHYDLVEGSSDLYRRRMEKYYEGWNSNGFNHWMPLPDPPERETATSEASAPTQAVE